MSDRPPPNQGDMWQPTTAESLELSLSVFWMVAQIWAGCSYIFMRRGFGSMYFVGHPLLVLPLIELYGVFSSPANMWAFHSLAAAWIGALLCHLALRVFNKGHPQQHSRYNGFPLICDWYSIGEEKAKLFAEPMLVAGLSWYVYQLDEHLGSFLYMSAAAMVVDFVLLRNQMNRRLRRMKDAEIDQGSMIDEFESRYGRR